MSAYPLLPPGDLAPQPGDPCLTSPPSRIERDDEALNLLSTCDTSREVAPSRTEVSAPVSHNSWPTTRAIFSFDSRDPDTRRALV
ncbi:hypothetical protein AURDEDRAFT_178725 [Auricularia subglabra TFB-10046 SS5]|uniref:Uncharacterized protein n=1 Tax=Auricularia subglabra (strain TFB-10046 / SS5) TaxID=717982 RepID=J0D0Z7_AURST|nr:hypothetical protein AURDEDRAFT_178725 [Auricularia subglabra TFB-10046 SS5]